MGVQDLWVKADGTPSKRHGRGLQYRVNHRGHPTKSFRQKKAAERYWLQISIEEPRPPAELVGSLLDVWLQGKRGLSDKGYKAAHAASMTARTRWGSTLVSDVKRSEVQAWIGGLESVRGSVSRPAAASTRSKALQALSGACSIAVEHRMIDSNPCDGVSAGRQKREDPRFLSGPELAALAESAGHWRPLILLLGTTGLRIGEACALDVGDVDAGRRRLRVRSSKSGRGRDVPIPASVLGLLDLDRPKRDPLLVSERGSRVNKDNFRSRVWAPLGTGLRVHDLRHTAASLAISSGADVKAVQRMLGHATATLTLDTYGHLFDQGLDDVAARMDGLLAG